MARRSCFSPRFSLTCLRLRSLLFFFHRGFSIVLLLPANGKVLLNCTLDSFKSVAVFSSFPHFFGVKLSPDDHSSQSESSFPQNDETKHAKKRADKTPLVEIKLAHPPAFLLSFSPATNKQTKSKNKKGCFGCRRHETRLIRKFNQPPREQSKQANKQTNKQANKQACPTPPRATR